ncbi:hypothetical protein KUW17_12460 [Leisingera aquaemixtae]|uniref:hypothetical protein n=1 Tax=Leisingera aquaemixtae TaxID=1396826 RepID=UPI001C948434|nr:hypothetical protein [Leisingera aquaemixtae]MBY6067560.1 hypothetical protein [Leisingera aquaemixtae]
MLKKIGAAACVSAMLASGCAQKSENVAGAYVSPLAYQGLSCHQIESEARRVSSRAASVSGIQDKNASNDAVATGVALVLFWPAAFFIKGNKENAAELARLKGELEALEQISIQKNCGIVFQAPVAEKPKATEEEA